MQLITVLALIQILICNYVHATESLSSTMESPSSLSSSLTRSRSSRRQRTDLHVRWDSPIADERLYKDEQIPISLITNWSKDAVTRLEGSNMESTVKSAYRTTLEDFQDRDLILDSYLRGVESIDSLVDTVTQTEVSGSGLRWSNLQQIVRGLKSFVSGIGKRVYNHAVLMFMRENAKAVSLIHAEQMMFRLADQTPSTRDVITYAEIAIENFKKSGYNSVNKLEERMRSIGKEIDSQLTGDMHHFGQTLQQLIENEYGATRADTIRKVARKPARSSQRQIAHQGMFDLFTPQNSPSTRKQVYETLKEWRDDSVGQLVMKSDNGAQTQSQIDRVTETALQRMCDIYGGKHDCSIVEIKKQIVNAIMEYATPLLNGKQYSEVMKAGHRDVFDVMVSRAMWIMGVGIAEISFTDDYPHWKALHDELGNTANFALLQGSARELILLEVFSSIAILGVFGGV